jgi:LacI family transcriptional regulator
VHAVLHSGLVLGRDLSVIVYDGLGSDSVVRTPVTAVMQPTPVSTGLALAEMTLARMRNEPSGGLQKLCMPELEIGDSDGPPAPG